jgi:DNA polymerase III gamma/tau subunit
MENIIAKLKFITQKEKIKIAQEALEMIALSAEGGMRDAESILGQIISLEDKNITLKEVEEILGTTDQKFAGKILTDLIAKDTLSAIQKINLALTDGYDLEILTKSLINYLRQLMLLKINPELKTVFAYEMPSEQIETLLKQTQKIELAEILRTLNLFLEAQGQISTSLLPQLPLEIAVIRSTHVLPGLQEENYVSQSPINQPAKPVSSENFSPQILKDETASYAEKSENLITAEVQSKWKQLLHDIAPYNHSLKALLSNCQIFSVENNTITLATPYDLYKDKLNIPANRSTVEEVFGKILETKVMIKTVLCREVGIEPKTPESEALKVEQKPAGEQNSLLASAMEIMGGKVVEE